MISQRLNQLSNDVPRVGDGTLYPTLHKLENGRWIQAEWQRSENDRRAKDYSLTRFGRNALVRESDGWNRLSAAITHIVRLEEA